MRYMSREDRLDFGCNNFGDDIIYAIAYWDGIVVLETRGIYSLWDVFNEVQF